MRPFEYADRDQSLIKRVQRGVFTSVAGGTGITVTGFLAVDPANTLLATPSCGGQAGVNDSGRPRMRLALSADGTTLTVDSPSNSLIAWEVHEYWPGMWRTVQRGTINPNGTATLNPTVNPSRALLTDLGHYNTLGSDDSHVAYVTLTDGATVTATANTGGAGTIGFQVAEPY